MKRQPQRTCVACRTVRNKRDMVRVVRQPDGDIKLDMTGKANGRGAYLCPSLACLEKGLQQGRLAHALKANLSSETVASLRAALQAESA